MKSEESIITEVKLKEKANYYAHVCIEEMRANNW